MHYTILACSTCPHIFISTHAHLCLGLEVMDHIVEPIQITRQIIQVLHKLRIVRWLMYSTLLPGTVKKGLCSLFASPLFKLLLLERLLSQSRKTVHKLTHYTHHSKLQCIIKL